MKLGVCARVFLKRARAPRARAEYNPRALRAPARFQKFARARSARALERGILTINNVHLLFCFDKITTKLQNLLIFKKQDGAFSA